MTPRNKKFAEEFIVDQNKTKAAERAKYSKKGAAQQGERLYRNVEIREYIDKLLEKQSKRTEVTADKILKELSDLAFKDAKDGGAEKEKNKIKCLELLGKNKKLFTEKVEVSDPDGNKLKWEVEIVEPNKKE